MDLVHDFKIQLVVSEFFFLDSEQMRWFICNINR
jgi:hypothetical protein